MKWIVSSLLVLSTLSFSGAFEQGKIVFAEKCSLCHVGNIAEDKIKENLKKNNTIYMLNSPSVNMIADAITQKFKQPKETEHYLNQALYHPDRKNSICNPAMLKFYDEKRPLQEKLSNAEISALAHYLLTYQKRRSYVAPPSTKLLNETYSAASILTKARNESKRIIIEAVSDNCEWCERMKREVIHTPEVQQLLQSGYVFADVNVDKHPLPYNLKKKFKQITPTFFILESDGTFVARYPGSWKREDFIKILKNNVPGR